MCLRRLPRVIQDIHCELTGVQRVLHTAMLQAAPSAMRGVTVADVIEEGSALENNNASTEEGVAPDELVGLSAAASSANGSSAHHSSSFGCVERFRRLINHPALLGPEELRTLLPKPAPHQRDGEEGTATVDVRALRTVDASCKLIVLRELLAAAGIFGATDASSPGSSGPGNKVLIFAQSAAFLDLVVDLVLRPGGLAQWRPGMRAGQSLQAALLAAAAGDVSSSSIAPRCPLYDRIDASTSPAHRQETASHFNQDSAARVLILTTRVGGFRSHAHWCQHLHLFGSLMEPICGLAGVNDGEGG